MDEEIKKDNHAKKVNLNDEDIKTSRKFVKYENGDIKYIRENPDLSLEDYVVDTKMNIKKKIKYYNPKDYIILSLIILFIITPLFFYFYYLKPGATNGKNTKQQQIVIDNQKTKKSPIKKEFDSGENQQQDIDTSSNDMDKVDLGIIDLKEIEIELSSLYRSKVDKFNSYFSNKSNRGGLRSTLEAILKEEKDLYIMVETIGEGNKERTIELQQKIINEIALTEELLEKVDGPLNKDIVNKIFNKYR